MRTGRLRHFVPLTSPSYATDDFGEDIATYNTYAKVWASVDPMSGKEIMSAQQQIGEITHKVRIRFTSAIAVTHRILHKGRTLEVVSIRDFQERGHFQDLLCKEIV